MPKITQVEPQKKNPKRFNIFLDGKFAFGADEDLVVSERLIPGKIVDLNDLNHLINEAEMGKLMEKMYRLFSVRARSEKEVRDYFKIKNLKFKIQNGEGVSDFVIDQIIEKLKQKDMVNDLEFAKAWVDARRKSKQKGIRAIKAELFQKGIEKEIVEEVVSAIGRSASGGSEEDLAKIAIEKKMKTWKNLDPQKFKQKTYEYLSRKGFEYEIIKNILDKN